MTAIPECPECDLLLQHAKDFVRLLKHKKYIMEQLRLDNLITRNDEDCIEAKSSLVQVRYLRDRIIARKHCHRRLADTLTVSNQVELLQLLSPCEEVNPPEDDLTTLRYRLFSHHQLGDPKRQKVPTHLRGQVKMNKDRLFRMKHQDAILQMMTTDDSYLSTRDVGMIQAFPEIDGRVGMLIDCIMDSCLHTYLALVSFLYVSNQRQLSDLISDEDTLQAAESVEDAWVQAYFSLLGSLYSETGDLEDRLQLPSRQYIDLTLHIDQDPPDGQPDSVTERIALEDIFKQRDGKRPRSILIVGHPGTGKSSAMKHIASLVAAKKWSAFPYSPFIIRLRSTQNQTISLRKLLIQPREAQHTEKILDRILELQEKADHNIGRG